MVGPWAAVLGVGTGRLPEDRALGDPHGALSLQTLSPQRRGPTTSGVSFSKLGAWTVSLPTAGRACRYRPGENQGPGRVRHGAGLGGAQRVILLFPP